MALSFTNNIDGTIRSWKLSRVKIAHVRMTIGAQADYDTPGAAGGFNLAANASKFGFIKIFSVQPSNMRQAGSPFQQRGESGSYNHATGKLQYYEVTTAGAEPDEIETTDIVAGDVVDMIVFGV